MLYYRLEADDRDAVDYGEESFGLEVTRSVSNKTPWQVNSSNTLLKDTGYSQSQSSVLKISSSASSSLYDLQLVSISLRRQLFCVLFGSKFMNFVE